jgi:hypothetical protein
MRSLNRCVCEFACVCVCVCLCTNGSTRPTTRSVQMHSLNRCVCECVCVGVCVCVRLGVFVCVVQILVWYNCGWLGVEGEQEG